MTTVKEIKKNKNTKISSVLADYNKKATKIKVKFLSLQKLNRKNINQGKIDDVRKKIYA
jgi:hypothetical protein